MSQLQLIRLVINFTEMLIFKNYKITKKCKRIENREFNVTAYCKLAFNLFFPPLLRGTYRTVSPVENVENTGQATKMFSDLSTSIIKRIN